MSKNHKQIAAQAKAAKALAHDHAARVMAQGATVGVGPSIALSLAIGIPRAILALDDDQAVARLRLAHPGASDASLMGLVAWYRAKGKDFHTFIDCFPTATLDDVLCRFIAPPVLEGSAYGPDYPTCPTPTYRVAKVGTKIVNLQDNDHAYTGHTGSRVGTFRIGVSRLGTFAYNALRQGSSVGREMSVTELHDHTEDHERLMSRVPGQGTVKTSYSVGKSGFSRGIPTCAARDYDPDTVTTSTINANHGRNEAIDLAIVFVHWFKALSREKRGRFLRGSGVDTSRRMVALDRVIKWVEKHYPTER